MDCQCVRSNYRLHLLNRLSPVALVRLYDNAGDIETMMRAGLEILVQGLVADRGLAFSSGGVLVAAGFSMREASRIRDNRLGSRPFRSGVRLYGGQGFVSFAEPGSEAFGMSGVIRSGGLLYVLAVERSCAFSPEEVQIMPEALRLLWRAFERNRAGLYLAWSSAVPETITLEQLPVSRLDRVPKIDQMAKLLIQEAMHRHRTKTAAAAALGMTREGLRKKIARLGLRFSDAPKVEPMPEPPAPRSERNGQPSELSSSLA